MFDERLQAVHIERALVVPAVDGFERTAVEVVGDFVIVDHRERRRARREFTPRIDAVRGLVVFHVLRAIFIERRCLRNWNSWARHVGVDGVAKLHEVIERALIGVENRVVDADIAAPVTGHAEAEACRRCVHADHRGARGEGRGANLLAIGDADEVWNAEVKSAEKDLARKQRVVDDDRLLRDDVGERGIACNFDQHGAGAGRRAHKNSGVSADDVTNGNAGKRFGWETRVGRRGEHERGKDSRGTETHTFSFSRIG